MSNNDASVRIERLLRGTRLDARVTPGLHARLMSALEADRASRRRPRLALALALAGSAALMTHVWWQLTPPASGRADFSAVPRIAARLTCDAAASLMPLWRARAPGPEPQGCAPIPVAERRLRQEWLALKTDLETILPARLVAPNPADRSPG